jgi:hypothetical protein
VAHGIRNAAFKRQGYSCERMPQGFSALALAAVPVRADFVFEKLAYVDQNRSGDYCILVDRQRATHKRLHGFWRYRGQCEQRSACAP